MAFNALPELSKPEYDVLRVLWKHKKYSVRETHDALSADNAWAYTTTKTVMDRMVKKALLKREKFHGVFIYSPLITRPVGLARLVQYFADRVLETDYDSVVAMFANNKTISKSEISELKSILKKQQLEDKKS